MQFFDIGITLLPIIIYGIFDKNFSKAKLNFSPKLYFPGLLWMEFNQIKFTMQIIKAVFYSLFITICSLSLIDYGHYENGHNFGFSNFSNVCLIGVVLTVNLQIFNFSSSFSVF